jgi:hypothetical protein
VTHRIADGVFIEDVRAMDQVAVAEIELVRPERIRHAPLRRAERRHEDPAVEYDLGARLERPEVAEVVHASDLVVLHDELRAVAQLDRVALLQSDQLQIARGRLLHVMPVGHRPDRALGLG